jgi:hypothetical protein
MKKLLIGLTLLASVSSFASDYDPNCSQLVDDLSEKAAMIGELNVRLETSEKLDPESVPDLESAYATHLVEFEAALLLVQALDNTNRHDLHSLVTSSTSYGRSLISDMNPSDIEVVKLKGRIKRMGCSL